MFHALKDMIISLLFSLLPIWFFPLILTFFSNSPSYMENIITSIGQGDLFIYSSALIGPLIYSITKQYGEKEENDDGRKSRFPITLTIKFPYGTTFFIISILVCMIAAICFGLLRFQSLQIISATLQGEAFLYTSIVIYVFTLSCMYCVSVYRLELESAPKHFGGDTEELMEAWKNR